MGYDIHVTRAIDWKENRGNKISKSEWLALVEQDSELSLDPENGEYAVVWTGGESPPQAWFDWYEGNIYTTNPPEAVLAKAIQLAAFLDAHVQGDDGKIYYRKEDFAQIPKSVT